MDMPMPPTSNHGFNLLGKNSLLLSHIPMFMPPHQAQLFLEVSLAGNSGQDPAKIYLDDQAKTGVTDYVLLSDPLVLRTLAPDASDRLQSFTGKLYRGWPFNNPNTAPLLVDQLTVHVKRAIYYHDITQGRLLTELTYLAFRTPETEYIVHKLVQPPDLSKAPKPPDFCQILSCRIVTSGTPHLQHLAEIRIPGVANDLSHKLNAHQNLKAVLDGHEANVETHTQLIYDPDHLVM
jgi:hypothetical protein